MIFQIKNKIDNLSKKAVLLLLFVLGFISAFSFAPLYLFPTLFIALPIFLYVILNSSSLKDIIIKSGAFGFGHFLFSFYWFIFPLTIESDKYLWMAPFVLIIVPFIASLYIIITALLTKYFSKFFESNLAKILIFAICWTLLEMVRGNMIFLVDFTGFPWNLLGYTLMFSNYTMQIASIIGVYGLTFLSIIIFSLPFILLSSKNNLSKNKITLILLLPLVILSCLFLYGYLRISYGTKVEFYPNIKVRLVHPSLKDHPLGNEEMMMDQFFYHIDLTRSGNISDIDYVIWSESGINYPFVSDKDKDFSKYPANQELLQIIYEIFADNPNIKGLISGGVRVNVVGDNNYQFFNSLFALEKDTNKPNNSKIFDFYDKINLVPFGEYNPYLDFIPFVPLAVKQQRFFAGNINKSVSIKNMPKFVPLICYDAIFPSRSMSKQNADGEILLNITNDIWFTKFFGNVQVSVAPYQHFDISRMRAVEEGMSLVRVANNGFTAITDPYGIVIDKLPLNYSGVLDTKLIKPLPNKSFYHKYGNITISSIMGILSLLLFILYLIKKKNGKQNK